MAKKNKHTPPRASIQKKADARQPKGAEATTPPIEIPPGILKKLNPDEQRQLLQSVIVQQSYQGPIPHPEHLRAYEAITPGLADRIIGMAERESAHRHDMEKGTLQLNKARVENEKTFNQNSTMLNKRAQTFALTIALVGTIGGIATIFAGHERTGTYLFLLTLGTLALAFLKNGRNNENEQPATDK